MNGKFTSIFKIEYWLDKGYSEEEAKYQMRIRRPSNTDYWINKGYSKEDAVLKVKECMSKVSKHTKSENRKKSNKLCKEYWVLKGFTEDETKEIISKSQSRFSKKICINKFGEVDGLKKWEDRQTAWIKKMNEKTDEEKEIINKKKNFKSIDKIIINIDFWKKFESLNPKFNKIALDWYKNNFFLENEYFIKNLFLFDDFKILKIILRSSLLKYKLNFNKDDLKKFKEEQWIKRGIKPGPKWGSIIKIDGYVFRSMLEYEFYCFLKTENIEFIYDKKYPFGKYQYDFFLPKYNLFIEISGLQGMDKEYDKRLLDKRKKCLDNNLKLIMSNSIKFLKEFIWKQKK